MTFGPRSEIRHILPEPHGGEIDSDEGRIPVSNDFVDFSVCTSPLGPPEFVLRDLDFDVSRYPDRSARALRRKLSERLDVTVDQVVFGNGSTELIRNVALAYFGKGDKVLIAGPTYGEYEIACKIAGTSVLEILADPGQRFRLGPDEIVHAAQDIGAKGIYLCNPNNPTGTYLGPDAIKWMLSRFSDGLLIIDEAYVTFADKAWRTEEILNAGNLIVVRSMTKDFGLPGLRIGYAVGAESFIDPLLRIQAPWNVNIVAQIVGERCLDLAPEYLDQVHDYAAKGSELLQNSFRNSGYTVIPSQCHYFLVDVGEADGFQRRLLRKGMVVRDCSSFGLPEYVRVAPRRMEENEALSRAVADLADSD